jgi:hypothetical protein
VVWLVIVGLLVLGAASAATLGRPLYWGAGLLGGLALLSAISSLWSGSTELSVIEADRVLVYLGFFLAAFLIAQTSERRQRFAEGIAIAVAIVALLGLGSRLLPHVLNVGDSLGTGSRLRYPLGYWNANGALCAIAATMLLWTSRRAAWKALRLLSVAVLPAVLLTLYFTFSRGGLLALVVASGCLLILSRDRLWLLATLAIGALGALPAVLAVQAHHSLTENLDNQAAVDQGVTVLLILLAGIGLALLLFAGLRRLETRGGQLTGRALRLSRNPTLLKRLALVGAACAIAAGPGASFPPPTSSSKTTSHSSTSPSSRGPAVTTSGGWQSTPSAKSRSSATAPAPTSTPGTCTARSPRRCTTPTRSTSRRSPSSAWSAGWPSSP